jgi:uncharacterized protein
VERLTTEASQQEAEAGALRPVEPGYRHVIRGRLSLLWLPLVAGAAIAESAIDEGPFNGLLGVLVPLLALLTVSIAPQRMYRRLRYGLSDRLLQVVRGWMFHIDTIVPLVRVQHIDVTRGPLDKLFGTATLVVHTAGTHNSIVTVPGLAPERAERMRDQIREHVRTDFG